MRKQLLIFYAILLCLAGLDVGTAWGQVTITTPTTGSTVSSPITVSGTASHPNTDVVRIRWTTGQNYSSNNQVFTDPLTPPANFSASLLLPAGTYKIQVVALNGNGGAIAGNTIEVTGVVVQAAAAPTVTNLTNGQTDLNPCGFTVDVADYPGATAVRVQWRRTAPNPQTDFITNTTRATVDSETPFSIEFPEDQLRETQEYQIRVTAGYFSGANYVEATTPTLLTVTTGLIPVNAQITSPINGSTGIAVLPTITADVIETGDCGTVTRARVQLSTDPTFNSGVRTLPYIAAPGPYEWTPTTALANSTTYYARLEYTTSLDAATRQHFSSAISFTTVGPLTVTNPPLAPPTVNTGISVCGLTVAVDPYPGTDYVEIRYAAGVRGAGYTWDQGSITSTQVTAFPNTETGAFTASVPGEGVQPFNPNAPYTLRIQAFTNERVLLGTVLRVIETGAAVSYTPVFGPEETANGVVLVPVEGSTNVSLSPTLKINQYAGCPSIYLNARIEIDLVGPVGTAGNADWTGADYQSNIFENGFQGPFSFTTNDLKPNSVYQARFTFSTNPTQAGNQTVIRFTTGDFLNNIRVVAFGDGNSFVNGAYRNALTQTFVAEVVLVGGTSMVYDWQFDNDPNFGSPIEILGQSNTLTFNAATNGFESGALYYVRVRGRNAVRTGLYPSPGSPSIVNYHHPLFQPGMTSPVTTDRSERNFSIKAVAVGNANEYYFQIAKANPANDGNPEADFADPAQIFVNPFGGNTTYNLSSDAAVEQVPSLSGNVLLNNRLRQWDWGVEVSYGTILVQPRTMYRSRVVATRKVNGQVVQQSVIGGVTTFGTMGIPPRAHPIVNIADGAVNVENRESQTITRIIVKGIGLNWDISEYQLQVSETPFTDNSTAQGALYSITGVTQYDPHFWVPNLKFGTIYYVRARSIGTENGVPGVPSPWTDPSPGGIEEGISFTTKGVPAPTYIDLRNVSSNRNAVIVSDIVSVADRYEWTLERTSAPAATYPVKVTDWVHATFGEYLVQGASYKLTVRAFSSAQAPSAVAYSAPVSVTFTVNPDASRSANDPAMAGTAEFLPSVIFPNPFQSRTSLQVNTSYEQVQVRAINVQGKVMLNKQAVGGETISLGAEWPAGMYVIQILNEQGLRETFRIVKQ